MSMRAGYILLLVPLALAAMLAAVSAAVADEQVYVYRDGQPVAYAVGEDVAAGETDAEAIHAANTALLATILGESPQHADLGYGATEFNRGTENSELYGVRKGGLLTHGLVYTQYLSPQDWQGVYGDYSDPGGASVELDKSGPRWSFDSSSFFRFGYIYGLDGEQYVRGERRRRMHAFTWRRGGMDGGVWRVSGLVYEMNREDDVAQARDLKLRRLAGEFRAVECGLVVEGGAYGGKYVCNRADMDNSFIGGRLDGSYWLADRVELVFDGDLLNIDAAHQNGAVTRANASAGVTWELCDGLSLGASLRSLAEGGDISATSHLTGYQDTSARLEYSDGSRANVAIDLRHREADAQRIKLEDANAISVLLAEPAPTREELAGLRTPASATSDTVTVSTDWRLAEHCQLSARLLSEQFSKLPEAGDMSNAQAAAPLFADERTQGSLALRYEMPGGAGLTFRAEQSKRRNSARLTEVSALAYAAGYGASLADHLRWNVGVSRNEDSVAIGDAAPELSDGSWNCHVSVGGEQDWADYRFTYAANNLDHTSGAYKSFGTELKLHKWPVYVTAWWRDRGETLGGVATFHDTGVNVAYHLVLQ